MALPGQLGSSGFKSIPAYRRGSPRRGPQGVTASATRGLLLAGGGTDQDAAMKWLIRCSGGGHFVVLRASGTGAYDPYICHDLGGVASCETIFLCQNGVDCDPLALDKIAGADALFVAGGNQWDYISLWAGTAIEDAIHHAAARGAPVGGTSSGLAILGEFAFSAQHGTVTSAQALHNPYHSFVTLRRDFLHLPLLAGVITDSHFSARDRMGRLVTFLARILQEGWTDRARAVGVDEKTALAVDSTGVGTLFGEGAVYFVQAQGMPQVCRPGTPLTFQGLSVVRLSGAGAQFDLVSWAGRNGSNYQLAAVEGALISTQSGGCIYQVCGV